MKKLTTVATLLMGLMAGAQAQADTRIGVTVYKYDDNFMSVVRKAIEKDGKSAPDVQLLMNDAGLFLGLEHHGPIEQARELLSAKIL